jgi:hypothetical protein
MGAPDSLGPLLGPFRRSGATDTPAARFEVLFVEAKPLEASTFAPDMDAIGGFPGMPGMKR